MLDSGDSSFSDTPVYKKGDIVWVKLGGCWWPGEVKNLDDLPEDLLTEFKKLPLVVVKFFDEDSYEYVKNWGHICPYNSEKKNDFIKKGMAAFRSKLPHMAKFPKDVSQAEEKTNGNPNILSDPMFLPVKKFNYTELFGPPTPKKTKTGKTPVKKTPQKQDTPHITHRRFLGHDDYQAFVFIQYPGKDRMYDSEDEEIRKINEEPDQEITCQTCSFKTKRLEVMILHAKMHINGAYKKKLKKTQTERPDSSTEIVKSPKQKQKRKKPAAKKRDIFSDLLEEWSDTDEELEEQDESLENSIEEKVEDKPDSDAEESKPSTKAKQGWEGHLKKAMKTKSKSQSPKVPQIKSKTYEDIKNCFDFDEDEEEEEIAVATKPGRKIPRVIPEKTAADKDIVEDEDKPNEGTDDNLENIFKEVMKETSVPNLGELIDDLKPEQNFHDGRTVKFPDKNEPSETASKLINPKKRFVKSFEDFELELRKKEEGKLEEERNKYGDEDVDDEVQRKKSFDEDIKSVLEDTIKQIEDINDKEPELVETEPEQSKSVSKSGGRNTRRRTRNEKLIDGSGEDSQPRAEHEIKVQEVEEVSKPRSTRRKTRYDSPQPDKEEESAKSRFRRSKNFNENEEKSAKETSKEENVEDLAPKTTVKNDRRGRRQISPEKEHQNDTSGRATRRKTRTHKEAIEAAPVEDQITLDGAKSENVEEIAEAEENLKNSTLPEEIVCNSSEEADASIEEAKKELIPENEESDVKNTPKEEADVKSEESAEEVVQKGKRGRRKTKHETEIRVEDMEIEETPNPPLEDANAKKGPKFGGKTPKRSPKTAKNSTVSDARPGRRTRNSEEVRVLEEALKKSAETAHKEALERERKVSESSDTPAPKAEDVYEVDVTKTYKKNRYSELIIKKDKRTSARRKQFDGVDEKKEPEMRRNDNNKSEILVDVPDVAIPAAEDNNKSESLIEVISKSEVAEVAAPPLEEIENNQNSNEVKSKPEEPEVAAPVAEEEPIKAAEPLVKRKRGRPKRISIDVIPEVEKEEAKPAEEICEDQKPSETKKEEEEASKDVESQPKEEETVKDFPLIDDVSQIPLPPDEPVQNTEEIVEDKSMPPKKSRWSRRNSHPKKDKKKIEDSLKENDSVDFTPPATVYDRVKLDEIPLPDEIEPCEEIKISEPNESEIILPLKKSRRLNDAPKNKIDDDFFNFSGNDTSLMSTSLKSAVDNVIQSIETSFDGDDSKMAAKMCVPPKKKKIEVPDIADNETKEDIPQPPKKKIPKLFENSQTFERFCVGDVPQMSPLAKKKSFAFQEDVEESPPSVVEEQSLQEDNKPLSESELPDILKYSEEEEAVKSSVEEVAVKSSSEEETVKSSSEEETVKSSVEEVAVRSSSEEETLKSSEEEVAVKSSEEEVVVKSSSEVETVKSSEEEVAVRSPEEEVAVKSSLEESAKEETPIEPEPSAEELKLMSLVDEQQIVIEPITESVPLEIIEEGAVGAKINEAVKEESPKISEDQAERPEVPKDESVEIIQKPDETSNAMEVKMEEEDFKFSIQTNLSNLDKSNAEELSVLVDDTVCEVKDQEGAKTEEIKVEEREEKKVEAREEIKAAEPEEPVVSEVLHPPETSELVPIEGNLTVMSEKDLVDAQVEITTDKVISEKKPLTLSSFSMDFSESSNSSAELPEKKPKVPESDGRGTEFSLKAMTREIDNKPLMARPNTYERTELLDILEGNSNSNSSSSSTEQKFKKSFDNYSKKDVVQGVQGICDFEECIPSQIVLSSKSQNLSDLIDSPKLLECLSGEKPSQKVVIQSDVKVPENVSKMILKKIPKTPANIKNQKFLIKSKSDAGAIKTAATSKPIILSEQIIRPAHTAGPSQGVKRPLEDIEDVEAFIIPKTTKKVEPIEEPTPATPVKRTARGSGKAKILQQTIITPEGEVIQPQQSDDSIFDINSMPIVLSDELLTPESIESMPVVISNEMIQTTQPAGTVMAGKAVLKEKATPTLAAKKMVVTSSGKMVLKSSGSSHLGNTMQQILNTSKPSASKPRIISTTSSGRVLKQTQPLLSGSAKPTKYILLPSTATQGVVPHGKIIGSKQLIRKQPVSAIKTSANVAASPDVGAITGNKIMIVTNQQGQQHRLLLTPAQQKMLGVQGQPAKVAKTLVKGPIPKTQLQEATPGPSGLSDKHPMLPQKTTVIAASAIPDVSNQGLLMPITKSVKPAIVKKTVPKTPGQKTQKTILIKNQHGQTVKKIQGTDDEELDRQVAEQLEAIKASARLQQSKQPEVINYNRGTVKPTVRRSYSKKTEPVKPKTSIPQPQLVSKPSLESNLPALSPLSTKSQLLKSTLEKVPEKAVVKAPPPPEQATKPDMLLARAQPVPESDNRPAVVPQTVMAEGKPDRPLNQLVIQDALGNQTTITEGQILALPSETVDGQPQSYMLITLDESGNLTPLNNEALMSLDPSLGLGGDINNMVLQVDQGQGVIAPASAVVNKTDVASAPIITDQQKVAERLKGPIIEPKELNQPMVEPKPVMKKSPVPEAPPPAELQVSLTEGTMGDPMGGQQLIVTGDPVVTQKFLESLSDGTTDLASILANADGGSILIQADGQQILIKTNSADGPPVMMDPSENPEGAGNPIFSTQHKPNQDILAAALANTDVFQQHEPPGVAGIMKNLPPSQLSPNGAALYPMNVGNVLETSLTLSSPIMTPLEVPSISGKKIDDEADILNQVPKNVDLPITITDPNISQTVAHQQAAGLMELSLPISEATVVSTEMNSPSFSYSLPAIEDSVEMSQKPFNGSMPLLTEDVVEETVRDDQKNPFESFGSLPVLTEDSESNSQGRTVNEEDRNELTCGQNTFEGVVPLPLLSADVEDHPEKSPKSSLSASTSQKSSFDESGLCTLGGEMCSSLSEPPPDVFDLGPVAEKEEEISSDQSSVPETETLSLNSEGSGEIPVQPHIVAKLSELKRSAEDDEQDVKRTKFD